MKKTGCGVVAIMMMLGIFGACAAPLGPEAEQSPIAEVQEPLPEAVCREILEHCLLGCQDPKYAPDRLAFAACWAACHIIYMGCLHPASGEVPE